MHKKTKVTKGVSNIGALFDTSAAENDPIVASKASCAHPTVKLGLYCLVQWCLVSRHKSCEKIELGRTKADSITGSFDQRLCGIFWMIYTLPRVSQCTFPWPQVLQTRERDKGFQCVLDIFLCKLLDFYEDKNETLNGVKPISTSENITLYQLKSSTNNRVLTAGSCTKKLPPQFQLSMHHYRYTYNTTIFLLFSDVPSSTHTSQHDIDVGSSSPIKQLAWRQWKGS